MSHLTPLRFDDPASHGFDLGRAAPSFAAAQRASLGRGLAFVLMLAAASLASVYAPCAFRGADWVEGTAAPRP